IVGFSGEAGRTGATLQWNTPDYPTTGRVIWGLSPDSMSETASSGSTGASHRVDIQGLIPSTTYYFQAIGQDDLGAVKRSQVIMLQTRADWNISGLEANVTETTLDFAFRTI